MVEFKDEQTANMITAFLIKYQYLIEMLIILMIVIITTSISYEILIIGLLLCVLYVLFKICKKLDNIIIY